MFNKNRSKSVTDPIQQKYSTFIHVEMGFDAFGLCVCVLLKAAAYSRQFDCGQVQGAKHTAKHNQQGEKRGGLIFILTFVREHSDGSRQQLVRDHTFELL